MLFLHGLRPAAINSVAVGGWSIAVEAMFYVIAPLLYRHAGRIGPTGLLYLVISIGCVSGSWALALACAPQSVEYFTSMWFPVELPVFLIGILTYLVWRQSLRRPADVLAKLGERGRRSVSASLLLLCAVLLLMSMPTSNLTIHVAALAFAPLVVALAIHPWAIFVNPVTRFVGRISFSIYLTHVFCLRPVGWLLARLDATGVPVMHSVTGMLVAYAATLMLALPVAMVTYRWIELPGIAFGPKLTTWLRSVGSGQRDCVPVLANSLDNASTEMAPSVVGYVR
jgi:peptidoglycan/LPS O-acetylase OafA/YrhL